MKARRNITPRKEPRVIAGAGDGKRTARDDKSPAEGDSRPPSAASKIIASAQANTKIGLPSGALRHGARLLGRKA